MSARLEKGGRFLVCRWLHAHAVGLVNPTPALLALANAASLRRGGPMGPPALLALANVSSLRRGGPMCPPALLALANVSSPCRGGPMCPPALQALANVSSLCRGGKCAHRRCAPPSCGSLMLPQRDGNGSASCPSLHLALRPPPAPLGPKAKGDPAPVPLWP